jgi:hypothetical protein
MGQRNCFAELVHRRILAAVEADHQLSKPGL